jgi:DNA/RNA endonuclease YhcR with UshA esterase domain
MRFPRLLFAVTVLAGAPLLFAGSHGAKAPWSGDGSRASASHEASSSTAAARDCVPIAEAGKHIRKDTCVTGTVIRVEEGSHGVTYLDFCADYHACPFTVVVFASDLRKLGDLRQLQGRVLKIQGRIEEYDNRAEIILRHPQQLGEDGKLLSAMPKEYDVERQGHYSAGSFRAAKTKKARRTAQGAPVSIIDAEEQ